MVVAIEAFEVKKNFETLCAIKSLSIAVNEGTCFALLGPNGAGKTTAVEILEGLQNADSGSIKILGLSYENARNKIYEYLGVVLQETRLYKKFSVLETFELFASFYKSARDIHQLILELGLEDKKNVRLEKLSGGQSQRVYLGCALIHNPRVLFLDEPTTGLDPQARRFFWDHLLSLKSQGKTIFLTTHYMDEAEVLADTVAIMDHGEIIAQGSPKNLIQQHCGEKFLNLSFSEKDARRLDAKLKAMSGFSSCEKDESNDTREYHFLMSDVATFLIELGKFVETEQARIGGLEVRSATLEDVFIRLTGRRLRDA